MMTGMVARDRVAVVTGGGRGIGEAVSGGLTMA
jgi:NAD(P)-dependent dehydrogenase (short-subunit alcohol dehydrogenase family)